MEKKEPTTIKGYAMKYARSFNLQLSEEQYQRYYRSHLRKFGGWRNKFHTAVDIVNAIRRDQAKAEGGHEQSD